ncbi:uncharacterized protein LOC120913276 isoform X2 [Rana temporaria]|uniref:uncharacterized protein LOC120913276 isoform X2 n=1 Tax=Rana temporaria TaxID=8407 RepID=UPI001AAC7354|nr:uncharacterized protein LOC120913276 isoform X2 [Rana temporaria]
MSKGMARFDGGIVGSTRIHSKEGSLAYSYELIKGITGIMTFTQTQPDSMILQLRKNNRVEVSALFTKGTFLSEAELEEFKQWGECNGLQGYRELNISINYAQKCFGRFHMSKQLDEIKDNVTSWNLIAKSSSNFDRNYELRILYRARLEISKKGEEYTLREIITAPTDNTLLELPFTNREGPDGYKVQAFQTGEDLLLLGVLTEVGNTLYLASRNTTAKQSAINRFKTQALCFESKYLYFIPGGIGEDDDAESCADKLEQMVPINFRESVGKWILTVSAYEKVETALSYSTALHGFTEISIANNKVHLSHTSIHPGILYLLEKSDIEVDESSGHILYKDTAEGIRSLIYRVSPNCIMFVPDLLPGKLYLNCHPTHNSLSEDIKKFVEYANCRKYNTIVIKLHSSFCSDLPDEVTVLDVDKIAGSWKLAAVASNVPKWNVNFPSEIQFVINDGEVVITDGSWKSKAVKIQERRLQYAKGDEITMEMRFYDLVEDSLLTWVGNAQQDKMFLVLFTKSGLVKPEDVEKFKHFAACLSIPVAFIKE